MNSQKLLLILFVFILIITGVSLLAKDLEAIISRGTDIDSIGHMLGFFLLTWFLHSACRFPLITLSIALIFYAALTEIGQWYLGFRNPELSDFIADTVGILTFITLKWLKLMYFQRVR
ncbi:VanZ family protein [Thalassotalea sp. 1_MG-2023]|uniref:VanZ family protein n=1 Tax=Thalassotalea sp. 1_MG-2023 TaxID=3062680 RepID=UPI0026E2F65C|nr:VanZ family protein [Thalassotalea sp. 1_MG-2023]MDO6426344.1 VanZ family protein [Thalassotalea sp. 1_MG-2023]